ncbi:MAG TPA: patatin-like phospholipase family protein [Verrucomicrobiae bacterium]|nr:patatin-like phospholipase family protein [Verrucomicrobiae bacterium]
MNRRGFFAASASSIATVAAATPASARRRRAGRRALVLIGGANRGAYEAGAIQALVQIQGVKDGEPLAFDMVCGTSIGALNAYLVATAQYSSLMRLWRSEIAASDVFRLKAPYNQIPESSSGILSRVAAAYRLASGMRKDVAGVLDPAPVRAMLQKYVDPQAPVGLPLYVSTTDITRQQNQLFFRPATTPAGSAKQALNDELLAAYPKVTRLANDDILRDVLFASAAIPLFFDPIDIARDDGSGKIDQYVDGGITQNMPIDVAQLCVDSIHVTLLAPPPSPADEQYYDDALSIGYATFETMQNRILIYQVRLAYALADTLPISAYIIRPQKPMPGRGTEFDDQAALEEMWQRGFADMVQGWVPFVPPTDLLGAVSVH